MKFAHLTADVKAWAKRLVDDLNRADPIAALPAYADDAAADAAGSKAYRAADGSVRWRP